MAKTDTRDSKENFRISAKKVMALIDLQTEKRLMECFTKINPTESVNIIGPMEIISKVCLSMD